MECISEKMSCGTRTKCYAVNDLVAVWYTTDKYDNNSMVLGYHGERTAQSLANAFQNGIKWECTRAFFDKKIHKMADIALKTRASSQPVTFVDDITVRILYHDVFGRKVEFSNEETKIRLGYLTFTRMVNVLEKIDSWTF